MAQNQFVKYALGARVPSEPWWAYGAVSIRSALLVLALGVALQESVAFLGLVLGILLIVWVLRVVVRITLYDMAIPDWAPKSLPRFIGLAFVNLLEVMVAGAALVAATESIESGRSFKPQIETIGDALMSAAAPFGSSGARAETSWAQLASLTGLLLVFFMTVVVIAAAVSGVRGNSPSQDG